MTSLTDRGRSPHTISRPIMTQDWRALAYLHWPYEADLVQRMLPPGLEVDTFDGMAWVGLVPFRMERIAAPPAPAVPYLGTFPETNVRTYVRGPDGPGVWFNSLDVTRLLPVLVARTTYRLPYMWASMEIAEGATHVTYSARRRWPGPRGVRSHAVIEPGERIAHPSAFEHFLSARWRLYTLLRSRLAVAAVEHEPWPLHRARAAELDDGLVAAAGYPEPDGSPHAMYSPGVSVRVGFPRFVGKGGDQPSLR